MIIRKPYAFLIKNFKLIHLIIFILSSYVLYRTNILFNFFTEYAETRKITALLENNFFPSLLFVFSILIILFSIIILILLKQKDKPKILYVIISIYYFAFIIFCIVSSMIITTIELEGLTPQNARIIRDISFMFLVPQIVFIIFILIRTLGFDIKRFHFGEDLQSLQIDLSDNEEVEITSGIDSDKLYRKLEMKKEDLKEFYYENKAILLIIIFLSVVIIPTTLIIKYNKENKRYSEGEIISFNDYEFKINSSYITKYSYNGEKLLDKNNSYLIVSININNYEKEDLALNLDNLKLEINDSIYEPTTKTYASFIDLGIGYENQIIKKGTSKNYIVLYNVKSSDLSETMTIRYTDKLLYNNSTITANYKRTIINPISLDEKGSGGNISINNPMIFSKTLLKDTKFTINEYGIKDYYTYGNTNKYIVNQTGSILKLTYDFTPGKSIDFIDNFSDLLLKYGSIVYTCDNVEYTNKIVDLTPSNYKEKDLFLAVDGKAKTASNIKIVFNIRTTKYIYTLI